MVNTRMGIRRRMIGATAIITVTLQLAITAVATMNVCLERPHTHGGTAAPDCPMHHQSRGNPDAGQHHSHHGQAMNKSVEERSAQQITCRCPSDVTQIYLGQVAILQTHPPRSPFVQAVPLDPPSDAPVVDHDFSPPPPPPR